MKRSAKMRSSRGMTRREFLGRALMAAAGVIAGAPAILRGQNLNNKLNIAFIACGGGANGSVRALTVGSCGTTPKGRKRILDTGGPAGALPEGNVFGIVHLQQTGNASPARTH